MSLPLPLEKLLERKYWTPSQCARVLGRGSQFWAAALDAGDVEGYRAEGGRRVRYIDAVDADAFLKRGKKRARPDDGWRVIMAEFRRRRKAERAEALEATDEANKPTDCVR